jgi:hypothetical protein
MGIARRIEQTSGDKLVVNYGTNYPALLKLEQEGAIAAEWDVSDNNRRARFLQDHTRGTQTAGSRSKTLGPDRVNRVTLSESSGGRVMRLRVVAHRASGLFGAAAAMRNLRKNSAQI